MSAKIYDIVAIVGPGSRLISIEHNEHELTTILDNSNIFDEIQNNIPRVGKLQHPLDDGYYINYCSISFEDDEQQHKCNLLELTVKMVIITTEIDGSEFFDDRFTIKYERSPVRIDKGTKHFTNIVLCHGIQGISVLHFGNDPELASKLNNDDNLNLHIIGLMQAQNLTEFGIYIAEISITSYENGEHDSSVLAIHEESVSSVFFKSWCEAVHSLCNL